MKSLIALIMTELVLAVASGCGGSSTEKPGDALASSSSSGSTVAPDRSATRSAEITESRIPVTARSRGDVESRDRDRARSATLLGVTADEIGGRTNRATVLVEVSVGKDQSGTRRTGTAFCVDASGLFVTHANIVKGVTEAQGQVRMLFGDRLEPRTVVYPKIVRIDDENNLASLQIDPAQELPLAALLPAKSLDVSPGATVVVFGFPRGQHITNHDAKGLLVEGPKFDFTYFDSWGKEPPDHLIIPMEVKNVWRENGRPSTFDFVHGPDTYAMSSGAPALNASGEVVGIITRSEENGLEGAISAERLSRFLGSARRQGDPAGARPEADRFAVIAKCKKATALVEVGTRAGECSGTAFCIDRSALFITNAHVIEDTIKDSHYVVNLVMGIGLPTQRTRRAEVVRVDPKIDLALIKTEADPRLEPLDLGTDGELVPTMPVTTFGFPFGKLLAGATGAANNSYPEVAVNPSRVTALGPELRFDGQINPGNSGGPVVDSRGKVIGVARATILGAALNFAIPVGQLRKFLATPGLQVRTLPVAFQDRARPTTWRIQVVSSQFAKLPENLAVRVAVADGVNPPRKLWAEAVRGAGGGAFRLEFVPMPRDPGRGVALAIGFGDHTEHAVVEDRDVTIGGRKTPLGAVRHLVIRPQPWAYVTEEPVGKEPLAGLGEVVKGPVAGLDGVMALQGAERKPIDLSRATEFTVVAVEPVKTAEVGALIEVYKGGKDGILVCGSRTRLQISDASAAWTEKTASAPPQVPQLEKMLTLVTRTMPRNSRTARLRLDDKESMFQLGGELNVTGVPRGAAKAIRPPRVAIDKALASSASEAGLGTRRLDVPAPPPKANPGVSMHADPYSGILAVCFSRDGSLLALGLQESIRVHDVASGRLIKKLDQPHATQLAFAANQAKLMASSPGYTDSTRRDPQRAGNFVQVPPRGPVIWDLKTGTSTSPPPIRGVVGHGPVEWISPDSRFVLTRGTGIKCWDNRGGEMRLALEEDSRRPFAVKTVDGRNLPNPVVTADGKRLLSFYAQPHEAPPKAASARRDLCGSGADCLGSGGPLGRDFAAPARDRNRAAALRDGLCRHDLYWPGSRLEHVRLRSRGRHDLVARSPDRSGATPGDATTGFVRRAGRSVGERPSLREPA